MTQPDLVSKLREALEQLIDHANCRYDHHGYCQAHAHLSPGLCPQFVAKELLRNLGREGQAAEQKCTAFCAEHDLQLTDGRCPKCRDANGDSFVLDMQSTYLVPTCGPSQPETEGEAGRQPVRLSLDSPSVQAAPSTPIVPGTPGLSAEQVREAHVATMRESLDFQDSYFYRKLADRLNIQIRLNRIAANVEQVVRESYAKEREAQIRKDVLREAFLLRPGLPHEWNSTQFREGYYAGLEAFRQAIEKAIAAERPAPAGEVPPATVEVCGMCGGILEGDYCAACDAHVEEDARDHAPSECWCRDGVRNILCPVHKKEK